MKQLGHIIGLMILAMALVAPPASAQLDLKRIGKRVKRSAEHKVENAITRKANKEVDKAIQKTADKGEEAREKATKKREKGQQEAPIEGDYKKVGDKAIRSGCDEVVYVNFEPDGEFPTWETMERFYKVWLVNDGQRCDTRFPGAVLLGYKSEPGEMDYLAEQTPGLPIEVVYDHLMNVLAKESVFIGYVKKLCMGLPKASSASELETQKQEERAFLKPFMELLPAGEKDKVTAWSLFYQNIYDNEGTYPQSLCGKAMMEKGQTPPKYRDAPERANKLLDALNTYTPKMSFTYEPSMELMMNMLLFEYMALTAQKQFNMSQANDYYTAAMWILDCENEIDTRSNTYITPATVEKIGNFVNQIDYLVNGDYWKKTLKTKYDAFVAKNKTKIPNGESIPADAMKDPELNKQLKDIATKHFGDWDIEKVVVVWDKWKPRKNDFDEIIQIEINTYLIVKTEGRYKMRDVSFRRKAIGGGQYSDQIEVFGVGTLNVDVTSQMVK